MSKRECLNREVVNMGWMEFVLGIATLVLGTGWLFSYRAFKKKANGEATVAEAEGWIKQQEAYHNSIEEWKNTCEFIRKDRDELRRENEQLRKENKELRKRIGELEDKILDMQRDIARNGRRIEALVNKEKKKKKEDA